MKNIEDINRDSVKKNLANKKFPEFFSGDTVKVGVRIVEGKKAGKLALCPMYPQSAACQPGLNPSAR